MASCASIRLPMRARRSTSEEPTIAQSRGPKLDEGTMRGIVPHVCAGGPCTFGRRLAHGRALGRRPTSLGTMRGIVRAARRGPCALGRRPALDEARLRMQLVFVPPTTCESERCSAGAGVSLREPTGAEEHGGAQFCPVAHECTGSARRSNARCMVAVCEPSTWRDR